MTGRQIECLFRIAAIEFYSYFGSRLDCVDPSSEFGGRTDRLLINLSNDIAKLQSCEIGGAVVDDSMNLKTPSPGTRDTAAARHISDA